MSKPILLIDLDSIADLSPWEPLAKAREWSEFFSHIGDATPRDNGVADFIELVRAERSAFIAYTSRWDISYRPATLAWLESNDLPRASMWLRKSATHMPESVVLGHARLAVAKMGTRPLLCIEQDPALAERLRARGLAVVTPAELPASVKGLRRLLNSAPRPVPGAPVPVPAQVPTEKVS